MQLIAKLVQILPAETGMGKNGEWKKQSIIVETEGMYPKKVCVTAWGDKLNPDQLQIGSNVTIDFDLESREFNGRWYTDVKAWKVSLGANVPDAAPAPAASSFPEPLPEPASDPYDDMPF